MHYKTIDLETTENDTSEKQILREERTREPRQRRADDRYRLLACRVYRHYTPERCNGS
jgi:hypothetical protein